MKGSLAYQALNIYTTRITRTNVLWIILTGLQAKWTGIIGVLFSTKASTRDNARLTVKFPVLLGVVDTVDTSKNRQKDRNRLLQANSTGDRAGGQNSGARQSKLETPVSVLLEQVRRSAKQNTSYKTTRKRWNWSSSPVEKWIKKEDKCIRW